MKIIKKHDSKWSFILDHRYSKLIIEGSGSRKTNVLLNLIKEQSSDVLIDRFMYMRKILMNQNINF